MADNRPETKPKNPRKTYIPTSQLKGIKPVEEEKKEPPSLGRRAVAGATRVGSGWLGGALATASPGAGTIGGAAIGGLGEIAAQLIEGRNPLTRGGLAQTAVAAGTTAIPGGMFVKAGKAGASAIRSGAITGGAELARQAAAGEDINLGQAVPSALIGAASGGLIGRLTKAPNPNPTLNLPEGYTPFGASKTPYGPTESLDDFVKSGKLTPEALEKEAMRRDALGDINSARALRVAAARHNKGTEGTFRTIVKDREAALDDAAKMAEDARKTKVDAARAEEYAIQLQTQEQAAARKAAQEASEADAVEEALARMQDPQKKEVLVQSASKQTPEGKQTLRTIIKDGADDAADDAGGGGGKSPDAGGPSGGQPQAFNELVKASSAEDLQRLLANPGLPPAGKAAIEAELASRMFPQRQSSVIPVAGVSARAAGAAKTEAEMIAEVGGRRAAQAAEHDSSQAAIEEMLARHGVTDDTPAGQLPFVSKGDLPPDAPPTGVPAKPKGPTPGTPGGAVADDAPYAPQRARGDRRQRMDEFTPGGRRSTDAPERRIRPEQTLLGGRRAVDPKIEKTSSDAIRRVGAKGEALSEGPTRPPTIAELATAVPTKAPAGMNLARFFRSPEQAIAHQQAQQQLPIDSPASQALTNLWAQADVAKGTARKSVMSKIQGVRKGFGLSAGAKAPYTPAQKAAQEVPTTPPANVPDPRDAKLLEIQQQQLARQGAPAPVAEVTDPKVIAKAEKAADKAQIKILKSTPKGGPKFEFKRPTVPVVAENVTEPIKHSPGAKWPEELPASYHDTGEGGAITPSLADEAATVTGKAAKGKKAAAPAEPVNPGLAPGTGKPRLVKNPTAPSGGGTTLGFGLGGFNQIPDLISRYPGFSAKLATGAGGAAVGAFLNPDDPLTGAVIGGAAGVSLPVALKALGDVVGNARLPEFADALRTPEGVAQLTKDVYHLLPHIQRFNYLASVPGLGANAVVGPVGSGFFGALTKALGGDPRGWAALRKLVDVDAIKGAAQRAQSEAAENIARAEAGDPIFRAELGGPIIEKLPQKAREYLQLPGRAMHTGDVTVRNILKEGGFSEEEAREMTLTAEPYLQTLKKLVDMRRGDPSPMLEILLPFVKTPANIVEQGLLGIPGVGSIAQKARVAGGAAAMAPAEQAARQIIGSIVGFASYFAGVNMDPETARIVRRYITNAAGPYSMLAAVGFAAGQSVAQGRDRLSGSTLNEVRQALPLPTVDPLMDAIDYVKSDSDERNVPRGWVPGVISEAINTVKYGSLNEPRQTGPQPARYDRTKYTRQP